mgnify:CR=1 FL=1|tara:strand:- start:267 stop:1277 length:1011 start_codon:yes stop_codon:yes gene_type:complete
MNKNSIVDLVKAIKNFDIENLYLFLDDSKPYQDVSKSLFLKTLNKKFKSAKSDGCHSFDDIFFGICENCNKGCEGMTFFSESGHYLDLFIESKDGETVDDLYVCNQLTNFIGLEKKFDLGFSFCTDEEVAFIPTKEYLTLQQEYYKLRMDLDAMNKAKKLDDFVKWLDQYYLIRDFLSSLDFQELFNSKLYSEVGSVYASLSSIKRIQIKADEAASALISFYNAKSERDKIIWLFENENDRYCSSAFDIPEKWKENSCVTYDFNTIKIEIDLTGYEYVMDYFKILDNYYDAVLEKYKPLPVHFENSENGEVRVSLEDYLRLHNMYIDVVEKYSKSN